MRYRRHALAEAHAAYAEAHKAYGEAHRAHVEAHKAHVEVHEGYVEVHKAHVEVHRTLATHRTPHTSSQVRVQRLSKHQYIRVVLLNLPPVTDLSILFTRTSFTRISQSQALCAPFKGLQVCDERVRRN